MQADRELAQELLALIETYMAEVPVTDRAQAEELLRRAKNLVRWANAEEEEE